MSAKDIFATKGSGTAGHSRRADASFKEQQCSSLSDQAPGAAGQRPSIEVAFAQGPDVLNRLVYEFPRRI